MNRRAPAARAAAIRYAVPFGAQLIGRLELPVKPAQTGERRQRRELMDDDFRCRPFHRGDHGASIERVGDHRLGPAGAQRTGLVLGACHPGPLVARAQRERDEATAHGAAGAGDEHLHHRCSSKDPEVYSSRQRAKSSPVADQSSRRVSLG